MDEESLRWGALKRGGGKVESWQNRGTMKGNSGDAGFLVMRESRNPRAKRLSQTAELN